MATIPLKTITFPGLDNTYTVPQLDDTLTTAGKAADAKATGDKLDELEASEATKANVDGSYEQMTVGNAEQLVSSIKEEDKVPYVFRTSGGSIDIGDREVDKLIGGTVAWNQMYTPSYVTSRTINGVTFTVQSDGTIVANGTSEGPGDIYYPLVREISKIGHVLLVTGCPMGGANSTYRIYLDGHGVYSYDTGGGAIFKQVYDNKRLFIYINKNNVELNNKKFAPQFVDLTQMFGSTIADYIYSLEQATAGAGVAFFRKLFPKQYYAYNAGQLMSVKALSHDTTGFNQWDEEWESGRYNNSTGEPTASPGSIRSKNFIPVIPNTQYCFRNNQYFARPCYYDVNKTFISSPDVIFTQRVYTEITIPSNAYYMKFYSTRTTYNHDICINLHWDGERDGEYEPYEKNSYALDSDLELRGIPKLDSNNELYYDGDEYESDGTVTRKYGIVDLGTLTWRYNSNWNGYPAFYTIDLRTIIKAGFDSAVGNIISNKYVVVSRNTLYDNDIKAMALTGDDISIRDSAYSDAASFKTAMSGVYLVYELATSATESADPYTNHQIVNDFGTEEYVDTRDVQIPVGHVTQYQPNLRAKLEMAPNSPDGDGDYIVRQTNGENAYVPITFPADELPAAPTTDGNYVLKCTVASGTATFTWEVQS